MRHRKCEKCKKKIPSYGYQHENKARWCLDCKPPDTVDLYNKKKLCIKCKKVRASFGIEIGKNPKWCLNCKPNESIDVNNKSKECIQKNCFIRATFGDIKIKKAL